MFNHQYLPYAELNLLKQTYKKAALSQQPDVMQKSFDGIDKILSSTPDSSQKSAIYDELIYCATNANMNDLVHFILKEHPNIKLSRSILNAAAESGNEQVLNLCLEAKLLPDQFTLFRAVLGNHPVIITSLLEKYPSLFLEQSMLFTALSLGNIEFIDWLLAKGRDVLYVDHDIVNAAKQLTWSKKFNPKLVDHLEAILETAILFYTQTMFNHPN